MRLLSSLVVLSSLLLLPPPHAFAASSGGSARSGHVTVRIRRVANGRAQVSTTDLWFTPSATRLSTRAGSGPAVVQMFDGKGMYRWRSGDRVGQTWHPSGVRVVPDLVSSVLMSGSLRGQKRVGSGKVAGISCAAYEAKGVPPVKGVGGWRGPLNVKAWVSQDARFPYVMRTRSSDAFGNRLESEVTLARLNVPVPNTLFAPPAKMEFLPPTQVLRGRQVAGGLQPVAGRVAIFLADALPKLRLAPGRKIVTFARTRLALDAKPLATDRDVQEVRQEPYGGTGSKPAGEALMLYLKSIPAARLARAAGAARGRYLVVLLADQPVSADPILAPWAAENNRIPIYAASRDNLRQMAERLRGSRLPAERR